MRFITFLLLFLMCYGNLALGESKTDFWQTLRQRDVQLEKEQKNYRLKQMCFRTAKNYLEKDTDGWLFSVRKIVDLKEKKEKDLRAFCKKSLSIAQGLVDVFLCERAKYYYGFPQLDCSTCSGDILSGYFKISIRDNKVIEINFAKKDIFYSFFFQPFVFRTSKMPSLKLIRGNYSILFDDRGNIVDIKTALTVDKKFLKRRNPREIRIRYDINYANNLWQKVRRMGIRPDDFFWYITTDPRVLDPRYQKEILEAFERLREGRVGPYVRILRAKCSPFREEIRQKFGIEF